MPGNVERHRRCKASQRNVEGFHQIVDEAVAVLPLSLLVASIIEFDGKDRPPRRQFDHHEIETFTGYPIQRLGKAAWIDHDAYQLRKPHLRADIVSGRNLRPKGKKGTAFPIR